MADDKQDIETEQVINYLQQNPDFFLREPGVIESLQLAESPEGTISLAQRQVERLRGKSDRLNEQLHALIENARQNTELQARVHSLCLRLMDSDSLDTLLPMLMTELKQEFTADEVAIRFFYGVKELTLPDIEGNIVQLHIDDPALDVFDKVLDKHQPICGRLSNAQKKLLFGEQHENVASAACLPIGHDPCAGFLAIASHDEDRFHSNMATDYLAFLGEVLMRLLRHHSHNHNG